MTLRVRSCAALAIAIALAAAPGLARSQDTVTVRRDTVVVLPVPPRGDTLIHHDSLGLPPAVIPPDTVKPPLPLAEIPRLADPARPSLRWGRDSLFHTGALTLLDLLERIPGLTGFRTAWITSPMTAAYMGEPGRVRVFVDGLELDPLDPRSGGIDDLSAIPIWMAEHISIERGASEVRVHVQTWRVDRTTPESRVDVGTGDMETNLYRGFIGRRFGRGFAAQFAGEHVTVNPRFGGTASSTGFFARLGWANARWGFDVVAIRASPHRGELAAQDFDLTLPRYEARRTDGYARLSFGNPTQGTWFRLQAGLNDLRFGGEIEPPAPGTDPAEVPQVDSSRSYAQYVGSIGWSNGPLRLSATERVRVGGGTTLQTPAIRASVELPLATVSLFAEGRGADSVARAELMLRLTPMSFLSLGGAVGQRGGELAPDGSRFGTATFARLEGAVRVRDLWVGAGLLQRGAVAVQPPLVVTPELQPVAEPSATGAFASLHGRILGPLHVDAFGVQWNDSVGSYRPRYQTRSQLYVQTNLLNRFPSGNFGLVAALTHEYRSHALFPVADGVRRAGGYRLIGGLLEIRIQDAVATYQFRNLLFERYAQVPGFVQPQQTQFYGVRWAFWN